MPDNIPVFGPDQQDSNTAQAKALSYAQLQSILSPEDWQRWLSVASSTGGAGGTMVGMDAKGLVADISRKYGFDEASVRSALDTHWADSHPDNPYAQNWRQQQQQQQQRQGPTANQAPLQDQLQDFINRMQGTVSPNDPIAKALSAYGSATANNAMRARGIEGGMSVAASEQGSKAAILPYLQQRQSLALQGMQLANSRDLALRDQAFRSLSAQNDLTAMANKQAADKNAAIWSTVGGLGDTVASMYGYNTGGAGSRIAGGLGGAMTNQTPYSNYTPSGGGGGGFSGGGNFSNTQNLPWKPGSQS